MRYVLEVCQSRVIYVHRYRNRIGAQRLSDTINKPSVENVTRVGFRSADSDRSALAISVSSRRRASLTYARDRNRQYLCRRIGFEVSRQVAIGVDQDRNWIRSRCS